MLVVQEFSRYPAGAERDEDLISGIFSTFCIGK
jgi:tRNA U34 5-carboxymethylaminomethyl modifying GTPase MnmE/TrmE